MRILLIVLLFNSSFSFACLNGEEYLLKNKRYLYLDHETSLPFGHTFFTRQFDENVFKLDSLYNKTKDLDYLSDKGLILILQKKYQLALELYQFIEKNEPNRYSTASNMGTLYELMGENEKALLWINKAIKINPKSHHGSEWLHSKILEAKIKGESYFTSDFLLGIDFGSEKKTSTKMTNEELFQLERTLFYQLNERISFIKPKDKIVAVLLFELGNIKLHKNKLNDAQKIYLKAKEYGFNDALIDQRLELTNYTSSKKLKTNDASTAKNEVKIDVLKTSLVVLSVLIVILFGYIVFKKK